jgi:hypothetical protein
VCEAKLLHFRILFRKKSSRCLFPEILFRGCASKLPVFYASTIGPNVSFHLKTSMKTRLLRREELDKIRDYYKRLEVLIQDCLENEEFRLAWGIIKAEGQMTHSTRKCAEQAGLACIRGLGVAFDGVGFAIWQNRRKTGWRIQFFVTSQAV